MNKIEFEVEKELIDFFNYCWDGISLIYDFDNVLELELMLFMELEFL